MCSGVPFAVEKISPRAGLELGTATSAGQHLAYGTTGAPSIVRKSALDMCKLGMPRPGCAHEIFISAAKCGMPMCEHWSG